MTPECGENAFPTGSAEPAKIVVAEPLSQVFGGRVEAQAGRAGP